MPAPESSASTPNPIDKKVLHEDIAGSDKEFRNVMDRYYQHVLDGKTPDENTALVPKRFIDPKVFKSTFFPKLTSKDKFPTVKGAWYLLEGKFTPGCGYTSFFQCMYQNKTSSFPLWEEVYSGATPFKKVTAYAKQKLDEVYDEAERELAALLESEVSVSSDGSSTVRSPTPTPASSVSISSSAPSIQESASTSPTPG